MRCPPEDFRLRLVEKLPRLHRFARSISRGPATADDLVQATCERALSRWAQFDPGSRMESWLFAIMHSIWKNELRRAGIEQRAGETLRQAAHEIDGEREFVGKIYLSQVLTALRHVPADQAAAVTLVAIEELSYREAAEVIGIPMGTLESRIARGRVALGRLLEARERASHPSSSDPGTRTRK